MELKKKLSQLRKEKGLTQLELAEAMNVSRQAVSRWEVGSAVPTLDNLVSLSKVYSVPLDYLVHDEMEEPGPAGCEAEPAAPQHSPKLRHLASRVFLALCLIAAGALIATAAWKLYRDHQVRKTLERTVLVDIDGIHIITDNPDRFQNNPDEPRSYKMNPDGIYEEYSLVDGFRSLLDEIK